MAHGSDLAPYEHDALPAVPSKVPKSEPDGGGWFINGTQRAFISSADTGSSHDHVRLTCTYLDDDDEYQYCGESGDYWSSEEGCWRLQDFSINLYTKFNFSIWFDGFQAIMDMALEGEYLDREDVGTGSNSSVKLRFRGTMDLPDADKDEFWNNSRNTYEWERATFNKGMRLLVGEEGFPVFENNTGSRYAVGNSTYLVTEDEKDSSGTIVLGGTGVWAGLITGVIVVEGDEHAVYVVIT
ncbi:hypothetical protein FOVSG1_015060 [Fusarium oxysporum f. sp. vasinfectum]